MAKAFPLHALFQAIHRSVVQASRVAQEASIRSIEKDYFSEKLDEDGKKTGVLKPKKIRVELPDVKDGKLSSSVYDIPLFGLVKHQAITVDELKINFDVELHGLDKLEGETTDDILASTTGGLFKRKSVARVEMTFKGDNPTEGTMKLNDKIMKSFPN